MSERTEEARLRRKAERQGLILKKCRRRDPDAPGYGLYALVDQRTGLSIYSQPFTHDWDGVHTLTLEEVEKALEDG